MLGLLLLLLLMLLTIGAESSSATVGVLVDVTLEIRGRFTLLLREFSVVQNYETGQSEHDQDHETILSFSTDSVHHWIHGELMHPTCHRVVGGHGITTRTSYACPLSELVRLESHTLCTERWKLRSRCRRCSSRQLGKHTVPSHTSAACSNVDPSG